MADDSSCRMPAAIPDLMPNSTADLLNETTLNNIAALKAEPQIAEPIITKVTADPSRYVQNSVGSRLNDAAKSRRDWVEQFLHAHKKKKDCAEFRYIADRAMRSVSGPKK